MEDPTATPRKTATSRRSTATAVMLVVAVGVLMQSGSAIAVLVIGSVGVVQAVWLRTVFAAVLLAAIRPRSARLPAAGNRLLVAGLAAALMAMNFSFYVAISHAPVGIVVAIEFLGPLTVAVIGTRRLLDVAWIVLAAAGVALLAGPASSVSVLGLVFALIAAACWATFILVAKACVSRMEPLNVTTLILIGSSVVLTPVLLARGVRILGHGHAILLGLLVAILSSALPYFLELAAIQRVQTSTYGVLLSIEPAIAAFMGFVILSQRLGIREIGAMVAIMLAAAGASWTSASGGRDGQRAAPELGA